MRLRNISPNEFSLFARAGESDALTVSPDQVIDVPGELAAVQPADAYQIGEDDNARLWPHSVWQLVEDTPPKPVATPSTTVPPAASKEK
jgi:hypothetical protein